jgi:hypothetical protein
MSAAKSQLIKMLNEIPDRELTKVLDYLEYIKDKRGKSSLKDFKVPNDSYLDFWYNRSILEHIVH